MKASFFVNAGYKTGYGHIIRCLALADELTERGAQCFFAGNDTACQRAQKHGYRGVDNWRSDMWVVDLEGGTPPELARRLSGLCQVLVILNGVGWPDGDPGRLLADLVFYQGVTQRPYTLDWKGFRGEWFEGVDWLVLRKEFSEVKAQPGTHDLPRVVIAGGGSDPKDVTGKALQALKNENYSLRVISGPSNENSYIVPGKEVLVDPPNMAKALAWGDVAVVSYGMTAFECLALGLPTVTLSISEDHRQSSNMVEAKSQGALLGLELVEDVHAQRIRYAVDTMLRMPLQYSALGRQFVDGKGAQRVADKIMEIFNDD